MGVAWDLMCCIRLMESDLKSDRDLMEFFEILLGFIEVC